MRRAVFKQLPGQLKVLTRGRLTVLARAALPFGAAEQAVATTEAALAPQLACPRMDRAPHRSGHAS